MTGMLYKLQSKVRTLHSLMLILVFVMLFLGGKAIAVAKGYKTGDTGLQVGMVAALSINGSSDSTVERASPDSSDKVVGIVTTVDDSLVSVGSGDSNVLIENEGQIDGYVTDLGGTVQKGDLLVLSPLKGILMKGSGDMSGAAIAIAIDSPGQTSSYNYVSDGKSLNTEIAKVKLNLKLSGTPHNTQLISDSPLSKIGRAIVGREVSEIRVLIAMVIFIIVLIAESSILYGAISSSVTAFGRNPLARKIIRGELVRVILAALAVLIIGLGAVYGIIRV